MGYPEGHQGARMPPFFKKAAFLEAFFKKLHQKHPYDFWMFFGLTFQTVSYGRRYFLKLADKASPEYRVVFSQDRARAG
ncbi:hypothetical protein [Komagataeibacter xylinus]|uniref:hypothetical protein n=1 Tax=Komagataeibacter xylinus TaxID=28448 RepID=UPI0012E82ADA|nr:hypothetical protein [Komagataeibacter xylinus]